MPRLPQAIGALVLAGVVVGVVGTCATSRCGDDEVPAALWTVDDLPPLPAVEDNGWAALQHAAAAYSAPPVASIDALLSLDSRTPAEVWPELVEARPELDAWRAQHETVAMMAAFGEAMALPVFADGCAIDVASYCRHFGVFKLAQAATIHALWQATRGDLASAADELAAIIASHRNYRDTARTLMAGKVATANLQSALRAVLVLAWRADTTPADERVSLEPLRREIEAITSPSPVPRHAVIGQYVRAVASIDSIAAGDAELGGDSWAPSWVFDQRWTRDRVDRSFQASMAIATADPDAPTRPEALRWIDRALHPIGAPLSTLLDPSLITDVHIEALRDDDDDIARRRVELLARLR